MLPRLAATGRSVACAIALTLLAWAALASCARRPAAGAAPAPAAGAEAASGAAVEPGADPSHGLEAVAAPGGGEAAAGGDAEGDGVDHSDPEVAASEVAAKLAAESAAAAGGGGDGEGPTLAERTAADAGSQALSYDGAGGGGGGGGGGGKGGKGDGGLNLGRSAPMQQGPTTSPYGANGPINSVGGVTDPRITGGTTLTIGQVALSASSVPVFSRIELEVPLSNVTATDKFDADGTGAGLDLSATFTSTVTTDRYTVPGFWDGTRWRIRFAPPQAGIWSFTVDARDSGGSDRELGSLEATASTNDGWLRIESAQLRDAGHGTSSPGWFRGVGYNIGWQSDVENLPFTAMTASGMNLLSFWLQVPWNPAGRGAFEVGGVGTYDQTAFAYVDGVVERAEQNRVRLIPSIWSHDSLRDVGHPWGNPHWAENPYSDLTTAVEFFTLTDTAGKDTPQWRAQKNLYRYMVARWGYSPALTAWVALVEANGTTAWLTPAGQEKVKRWADAVRDHFASVDPFRRSAEGYPLTFSLTGSRVDSDFTGSDPTDLLDLQAADSYEASKGAAANVAVSAYIGDTYYKTWLNAGRLGFVSEFGGQVRQVSGDSGPYATQPAHLHNGLWAAIGAGATIEPLLWSDTGGFPFLTDATSGTAMRAEFARVAAFNANALAALFGGKTLVAAAVSDAGGATVGFRAANAVRGVAWVRTASGANFPAGSITFPEITAASDYDVTWFDTLSSSTATTVVTVTNPAGTLTLPLPAFATTRSDLAVLVVKTALPPTSLVRAEPAATGADATLARR